MHDFFGIFLRDCMHLTRSCQSELPQQWTARGNRNWPPAPVIVISASFPPRPLVVRLLNKCYWTRSFEQNRWTKNQLNKNLLNKKSIEQVDNWTNIWLNNYHLNKCIWTKLLQQLNKSWIEQVVTFLTWLRKLRLAECVVARQRHEARGVWGACPPF